MTRVASTVTIRSLTIGDPDGGYQIAEEGVGGLGTPGTKTNVSQLDGRGGSYAGPEFFDTRILTIPVLILGADQDDAMDGLAALNDAFAPANDGVDLQIDLVLPGWGAVSYLGRPRGVNDPDMSELGQGTITVLCQFECMTPTPIP